MDEDQQDGNTKSKMSTIMSHHEVMWHMRANFIARGSLSQNRRSHGTEVVLDFLGFFSCQRSGSKPEVMPLCNTRAQHLYKVIILIEALYPFAFL